MLREHIQFFREALKTFIIQSIANFTAVKVKDFIASHRPRLKRILYSPVAFTKVRTSAIKNKYKAIHHFNTTLET